jgi:hypothetical protein
VKIENEDDIYLITTKNKALIAYSLTISVTNDALGYKISYELVNFGN